VPPKTYLVSIGYVMHALGRRRTGNPAPVSRRAAWNVMERRGAPLPYYNRTQTEALHLPKHVTLYDRRAVDAWISRVSQARIDAMPLAPETPRNKE
jgi:hypothetical protein